MILMRGRHNRITDDPAITTTGAAAPAERIVEFLGAGFLVNDGVLAPRRETELLARVALDALATKSGPTSLIDMCCGSGNLGITIALKAPETLVWASDLTSPAVKITRRNVALHELTDRVRVVQGDMFGGLAIAGFAGTADLVVCNPPYISSGRLKGDRAELLFNEPREAFDGGVYGISILQRLVREALPMLAEEGWLAFEFGQGQARQARLLLERGGAYRDIEFFADENGEDRVVRARKRASAG